MDICHGGTVVDTGERPPLHSGLSNDIRRSRIEGLDLARALAMVGMVIVHYVWPDASGSPIDVLAESLRGRAMPLFMVLGGVGVSLLAERSTQTDRVDRVLLIRAVLLFTLGVAVHELSEWVAVVLQWYGLLFALAPLLRRLPAPPMLALGVAVAAAGGWTFQVLGDFPRNTIPFDKLAMPIEVVRALVVDGYYPFFPIASFFILGLWLGRLDLRSDRVAARLTILGLLVGLGTMALVAALTSAFHIDVADLEAARQTANPSGYDPQRFFWERLLHTRGHGQMPAWVVSAAGTSVAALGLCLLVAPRIRSAAAPLVSLGRFALTFYVAQVALTKVLTSPSETMLGRELLTALLICVGGTILAHLWLKRFRSGPLEALLRSGSGADRSRRPSVAAVPRR